MGKQYDIFISYRREGGKDYARNIASELIGRGYKIFLDYDELEDGTFDKRITDAIEAAPIFLFILSPNCLDRCVNDDDWVRAEILHAIKCNRHIIPVDFDGKFTGIPNGNDFPDEVRQAIGQQQFSQIQTETLYRVSVDKLVNNRIKPTLNKRKRMVGIALLVVLLLAGGLFSWYKIKVDSYKDTTETYCAAIVERIDSLACLDAWDKDTTSLSVFMADCDNMIDSLSVLNSRLNGKETVDVDGLWAALERAKIELFEKLKAEGDRAYKLYLNSKDSYYQQTMRMCYLNALQIRDDEVAKKRLDECK